MWYDNLFEEINRLRDNKQAEKMSAYMQNKSIKEASKYL